MGKAAAINFSCKVASSEVALILARDQPPSLMQMLGLHLRQHWSVGQASVPLQLLELVQARHTLPLQLYGAWGADRWWP